MLYDVILPLCTILQYKNNKVGTYIPTHLHASKQQQIVNYYSFNAQAIKMKSGPVEIGE